MTTILLVITILTQVAGFGGKRNPTFNATTQNTAASGDQGSSRLSDRPSAR